MIVVVELLDELELDELELLERDLPDDEDELEDDEDEDVPENEDELLRDRLNPPTLPVPEVLSNSGT